MHFIFLARVAKIFRTFRVYRHGSQSLFDDRIGGHAAHFRKAGKG